MAQPSPPQRNSTAPNSETADEPSLHSGLGTSVAEPGRAFLKDSKDKSRPTLVIEPQEPETGLVIIFHGAGGSAYCFKDVAEEWSQQLPHVKFIMPTAPVRRNMTAWMAKHKTTGACCNYDALWQEVLVLIEEERQLRGVPLSRVVLMGYSNGARMASWVALNLPKPCGGLILLSGLCPAEPQMPEPRQLTLGMNQTPILYMCGSDDVQITAKVTRSHANILQQKGFSVKFIEYPGVGHELIEEEFDEMYKFLVTSLPPEPSDPSEALRDSLAKDIAHLDRKLGTNSNAMRSGRCGYASSSRRCVRSSSSSGRPSSGGMAPRSASKASLARNCSAGGSLSACNRLTEQPNGSSRSSSIPSLRPWRR